MSVQVSEQPAPLDTNYAAPADGGLPLPPDDVPKAGVPKTSAQPAAGLPRKSETGTNGRDVTAFMDKVKKASGGNELDLSSDEDLGIGVMNLISIEEHLFFTANKTGKDQYYDLLLEVREMRKALLKKLVVSFEGEAWCISKHLLASSMRLMEVGTKELNINGVARAKPYFEKSYRLFRMFWELILRQPGRPDENHPTAAPSKKEVVVFYEPTCPHCKVLESFLTLNGLYERFNITRKDVSSNAANRAEMEKTHNDCTKGEGKLVVPMVSQGGECAMGEENSIRFFKGLVWKNVKESSQTVQSLLVKGGVPTHVRSHFENHSKAVDAALNCCKE